jgi:hypothetical protein
MRFETVKPAPPARRGFEVGARIRCIDASGTDLMRGGLTRSSPIRSQSTRPAFRTPVLCMCGGKAVLRGTTPNAFG